jgi:hypothetical protein
LFHQQWAEWPGGNAHVGYEGGDLHRRNACGRVRRDGGALVFQARHLRPGAYPIYSFVINSRVEFGDLTCFSLLALITVKCASELFRPSEKIRAAKSRNGRP